MAGGRIRTPSARGAGGSPGAVVLLKVGGSEPDAFFTGEHLQSVSVDGPGALQRAVGHALQTQRTTAQLLMSGERQRSYGIIKLLYQSRSTVQVVNRRF